MGILLIIKPTWLIEYLLYNESNDNQLNDIEDNIIDNNNAK